MKIQFGLTHGAKCQNPLNRYENQDFLVNLSLTRDISEPPDNQDDYAVWEAHKDQVIKDLIDEVRSTVMRELQADIDQFYEDNSSPSRR